MKTFPSPHDRLLMILAAGWIAAGTALAQTTATNRYDFEPTASYVTEAGWTHVDYNTAYSGNTSGGFDLTLSDLYSINIDRGASTWAPTNTTRDLVMGDANANTNVAVMVFRDIVPAYATNVSFTVYRSDPADAWPAAFTTKLRFAGGSEVTVDTGAGWGTYHAPITGNLTLSPVSTNTSLEYLFYATQYGGSVIRVNGIESIYLLGVPEPSAAALLVLPLAGWILARRRAAKA